MNWFNNRITSLGVFLEMAGLIATVFLGWEITTQAAPACQENLTRYPAFLPILLGSSALH